ncbi:MAG: hypothetical protein WDN75_13175 [Bacteroidota bacterium]
MDPGFKLDFFPKKELIIFAIAAIATVVLGYFIGLAVWLLIPIIALEYLVIMGGAVMLKIEEDVLTITPLNPFVGHNEIGIKSITKIKLLDRVERQADVDFGGYFLLYSRRFLIVYLDENQQKFQAFFSILSKKEEKGILKVLRKLTKKEKKTEVPEEVEGMEDEESDDGAE